MSSQSEWFSNIYYDFLGLSAANARGGNYQQQFPLLHQEIGKLWNRSGNELNFPKYNSTTGVPPTATAYNYRAPERKTIQQELSHMIPHYNMHQPYHMAGDPPKPNPLIPTFRNEFAELKIERQHRPEPQHQYMPPPPAKTTGLKPHCKFCKNNGEHPEKFLSHQLACCPVLTVHNCKNCNQKGHTQ